MWIKTLQITFTVATEIEQRTFTLSKNIFTDSLLQALSKTPIKITETVYTLN